MIGRTIAVDDTRFIFATNFTGDPSKDRFADSRRKANLMIPDPEQAKDLIKAGFNVKETSPRDGEDPRDFKPEYFVQILVKYRDKTGRPVKYPPRVFLVNDDCEPVLLDEESIATLDDIRVKNVNVILNPYEHDPVNHGMNLYVRTMYVEQDVDDDPYAARYRSARREAVGGIYAEEEYPEEPF